VRIRNPVVAGAFYPFGTTELRTGVEHFLAAAKAKPCACVGIVVPHAGYSYCGSVAAEAYKAASGAKPDTVIVLGPNHAGAGAGVATSRGAWSTPLGSAKIDDELAARLDKDGIIDDQLAHAREHSIEVQLPWIQAVFKDAMFLPVCINPIYFEKQNCKTIGKALAAASKELGRKVLVVASSDFTHYGTMYGNTPFTGPTSQILKRVKEKDLEIASYAARLMPERLLEVCSAERLSVCGYGAIAAMLWAAKELGESKGEVLEYRTSFDVSRDIRAVVGYAAIEIS